MTSIYRTRESILADMISQLVGAIPDVYTGDDGVIRIIFDIEAGQFESLYLAMQLLLEDMFVSTASYQALQRHGDQFGLPMMIGTRSSGTLQFTGGDGTVIPLGTLVAYDQGSGLEPVHFQTSAAVSIPTTGIPTAPITAAGAAGVLTGSYEYVVTYQTAAGETLPSLESVILPVSAKQINLTSIPVGGPGVTGRRIYRDLNGANNYRLVTTIANNTATTYTDNATDASIAGNATPPLTDTAHAITVAATAVDPGVDGNVTIG